jgi:hypothetical protein
MLLSKKIEPHPVNYLCRRDSRAEPRVYIMEAAIRNDKRFVRE